MSNAPRAWVTITGQTPANVVVAIQGQETLRTVYFDPAFARVEIDTSVNPPRAKITSGLTQLTADVAQLQLDVDSINTSIGVLEIAVNAKVASVDGDAPIVVNNTDPTTPVVTIDAATALAAGSMSAAHFSLVNGATAAPTASTLIVRDANARAQVADPLASADIDTLGARTTAVSAVSSRVTIIESPGNDYAWSPARFAAASGAAVTRNAVGTSYTHGIAFYVTKACNCVGIEGYWSVVGTETVRGELWSPAGASLANASVSRSSSGIWTVTFGSPVALTPYQLYHVTQCVSGSSATTTYAVGTTGITLFSAPFSAGHGLFINSFLRHNTAANTFPNATGAQPYPVFPTLAAI